MSCHVIHKHVLDGTFPAPPVVFGAPHQIVPERLLFKLVPNTQPECPMVIHNSSDGIIAFKVKTNEPRRYIVRPNQGLIRAGAMEAFLVFLIEKECKELLRNPPRFGTIGDKFLIQTTVVGDEFYAKYGTLCYSKQAEQLTNMWSQAERSAVTNKKLPVRLILPSMPSMPHEETATPTPSLLGEHASFAPPSLTSSAGTIVGGYTGGDEWRLNPGATGAARPGVVSSLLVEDPMELATKYDVLVKYTARLAEKHDELRRALEDAHAELRKERAARMMLEKKDAQPQAK